MTRFYFYKLTADNNGAPCLDKDGKLLSLAICKPMIRNTGKPGDLIFGFAAKSLHADNRLLYIAHITAKECNGDYYKKVEFSQREDCIYEWLGDRFVRRENARHHDDQDDLIHDIGEHPNYKKANVLLSDDFRYFGKSGNADYKKYRSIEEAVEKLGRGHRVNHVDQLKGDLEKLKKDVWEKTQQEVIGERTSESCHGVCHRTRSYGVI